MDELKKLKKAYDDIEKVVNCDHLTELKLKKIQEAVELLQDLSEGLLVEVERRPLVRYHTCNDCGNLVIVPLQELKEPMCSVCGSNAII